MSTHIAIGDVRPRIQYAADGGQTVFPYPFPVFADSDLEVWLDSDLQDAGFSVTGAGADLGGNITFAAPPAAGVIITLRRRIAIRRTSDFQEGGAFRAKVINDELDYQTAALQQVAEDTGRCLRLTASDADADLELPIAATRATKLLAFDADGNVTVSGQSLSDMESASETATAAATTAAANAAAIQTALQSFDARYLGQKAADPTLDNDGDALVAGALYFNAVDSAMKVYTGSAWTAAYVSGTGYLAAANNLNDLNSAATARANLGLAIGTNVQAFGQDLTDIAGLTPSQGDIIYRNASAWTRLAAGTGGQFLKTNGAGADPAWASAGSGAPTLQVFASSGTWTKPAGLTTVVVEVIGAGGGGGGVGSDASYNTSGGGGAGGGYATKRIAAGSLGATETVTVGAGGAGGSSGGGAGGTGGTSSFGAHCSATGGNGSNGAVGGAYLGAASPGDGVGGDINHKGGMGGSGLGGGYSAWAATSHGGPGGAAGNGFPGALGGNGAAGNAGSSGAGGGGGGTGNGSAARAGGAGGAGLVLVWEFY